eukprot:4885915-Pyramimonas_sp.AAC.1
MVQEGVLQGHQSAQVTYVRTFDRCAIMPWLEERRAQPYGRGLVFSSPMNDIDESEIELPTAVYMDDAAHDIM